MENKVVVLSGGAGGIGYTCANEFLKNGYKVVIVDLQSDKLNKVKEEGKIDTYPCDLTDIDSINSTVKMIVDKYGKINSLIQVAGLMKSQDSLSMDENTWDLMFKINAKGTFFLAKAVVENSMIKTGGSIVNFSSAAAIRGFMGTMASPHYGASKAAIISLTQQLACEWGKYNIRVNAVVPGGVMTEAMKKLNFDESSFENIPLQRLSTPQDIANVVYFLASDKSSMITGQSIVVDGGANCVGQ